MILILILWVKLWNSFFLAEHRPPGLLSLLHVLPDRRRLWTVWWYGCFEQREIMHQNKSPVLFTINWFTNVGNIWIGQFSVRTTTLICRSWQRFCSFATVCINAWTSEFNWTKVWYSPRFLRRHWSVDAGNVPARCLQYVSVVGLSISHSVPGMLLLLSLRELIFVIELFFFLSTLTK